MHYKREIIEYADFVTPLSHTVRYVSEGKTLHEVRYYSTAHHAVSTLSPERDGYEFLHWSDASGKIYQAGERLPAGDGVLTAVFAELPEVPVAGSPVVESGGEQADHVMQESHASPQLDAPPTVLPNTARSTLAATRHAGVVSGLLALTLGGVWLALKRREE